MLWKIHRWLIRLIVGRVRVMANLNVIDGVVQVDDGRAYIWCSEFTKSKGPVFQVGPDSVFFITDSKVHGSTKVEYTE